MGAILYRLGYVDNAALVLARISWSQRMARDGIFGDGTDEQIAVMDASYKRNYKVFWCGFRRPYAQDRCCLDGSCLDVFDRHYQHPPPTTLLYYARRMLMICAMGEQSRGPVGQEGVQGG